MYATRQDIIDRYGLEALLIVADRDADGAIDDDAVDRALADTSSEIDTYLAAKYTLPLPVVPEVLKRLCVDIALYRLSTDAATVTEEKRQRYEDAVRLLEWISTGRVSLGLPEPPPSANGGVYLTGPGRVFTRDTLRRLT